MENATVCSEVMSTYFPEVKKKKNMTKLRIADAG
jgi:hypothetical protein